MRDQRDPLSVGQVIELLVKAGTPSLVAADLALAMVPASGSLLPVPALAEIEAVVDPESLFRAAQRLTGRGS